MSEMIERVFPSLILEVINIYILQKRQNKYCSLNWFVQEEISEKSDRNNDFLEKDIWKEKGRLFSNIKQRNI